MSSAAVIIVAGGRGSRMGAGVAKQFLCVGDRPVLMHTIDCFRRYDARMPMVVALPREEQAQWQALCKRYAFCSPPVVDGGRTRFHSVKNALAALPAEIELVGVHDGVRPFVAQEVIAACYAQGGRTGAAVPVCEVVETLRHLEPGNPAGRTVPRSDYRLVQTPQVFRADWLREAYAQPFSEAFTDDACVVEAAGHDISLVAGNRENIKLTLPFDMVVAEALWRAAGGKDHG